MWDMISFIAHEFLFCASYNLQQLQMSHICEIEVQKMRRRRRKMHLGRCKGGEFEDEEIEGERGMRGDAKDKER